jgi:hypothetical protein
VPWSWSYDSWINNYLCNQCLSLLKVCSIQHYVIKFVSDLWQVCGFLRVLRFPPPIKLTATWWRLFQKRVMHAKFDIYVFIINECFVYGECHTTCINIVRRSRSLSLQGPPTQSTRARAMVFNATFNNISVTSWSVLLV